MYTCQSGYISLHFCRLPSDILVDSYCRDIYFSLLTFNSCNRCVIEVLVAFCVVHLFSNFLSVLDFCHRTESDLLLFLLLNFPYPYPLHPLKIFLVSRVEICHRRIKIRNKLLASRFVVIPHTIRVNVGCIMLFGLTAGFGLILF